jgi:outer membrane immunogenic protein
MKHSIMKIFGLTLMMVSPFSQAASQATVRPTQPTQVATAKHWQGFYVGGYAGSAFGHNSVNTTAEYDPGPSGYFYDTDVDDIASVGSGSLNSSTFNYGILGGYNLQLQQFILGVEASFGGMNLNGSRSVTIPYSCVGCVSSFTLSQRVKTNWLFMARPRVGYAFQQLLVYGTAGYALTDLNYQAGFNDGFGAESGGVRQARSGWSVGAGLEYQIAKHWSFRGEYLYLGFGDVSDTSTNLTDILGNTYPTNAFNHHASLSTQLVTFALNYRF